MLSALELNGFKSFADRTRFEFPSGVTVVVGPNGSGKSNVVDAIKWVLGSQSAKSLRGKEMIDVIFSGSRTRRQANAAEASLVLDNSAGALDHDAREIQITRRVYRSGEGEYLINRQPCRLRDVRDLLSGAGVSTGGYSIIEQGRVDAVLQSSAKERRLIFEETAGISRFRVKREEAVRRLERVQQNLLRLGDIVEELSSRLKTVRAQAARAQRYTELASRVQQLRTRLALDDWGQISGEIDGLAAVVARDDAEANQRQSLQRECDALVAAIDAEGECLAGELRAALAQDGALRERLAQCDSTRSSHLARIDELEQEVVRLSHQLLMLTSRAGDAQQLVADTERELEASQQSLATLQQMFASGHAQATQAEAALVELRRTAADAEATITEHQGELTRLLGDRQRIDATMQALDAGLAQRDEQGAPLAAVRQRHAAEWKHAAAELSRVTAQLDRASADLQAGQNELAHDRAKLAAAHKRVAELGGRLTGARERTSVLEELEARLDGLTSGAKDVLRAAREDPEGPFRSVRGVVADLLHVDADTAPLIEIALGERANFLVVTETKALAPALAAEPSAWAGRTTFLRLDVPHAASAVDRVDLAGESGVMGRADEFVESAPELAPLVRRLLGRTWLVDSFATAARLSVGVGRGLNFVTAVGEAVLADGTLAVGPRQSVAGMLSRRSELRALRDEIESLQSAADQSQRDAERLDARVAERESAIQALAGSQSELVRVHGELRVKVAASGDRLEQLDAQLASLAAQRAGIAEQLAELAREQSQCDARQVQLLEIESQCRATIAGTADQQAQWEQELADLQNTLTEGRVELARGEQRVEGLQRQMEQLVRDHAERDRALEETRSRATHCQTQRASLQATAVALAEEAKQLRREREQVAARLAELEQARQDGQSARLAAVAAADAARSECAAASGRAHTARLQLQQFQQQRTALAQRLQDDYQLDLAALAAAPETAKIDPEDGFPDRAAAEAEIRELRDRLQASGPVNLESLAELETLEGRSGGLAAQYEDLQQARSRLEEVIQQINGESRQLLVDVIKEVREHFQDIFRRLFGGGEADLVVEDDPSGDVLECGVSIVARPPGKQPRNISLLSGGERTLTCVALLLAIFRSRPSPFCVLDEVDAALDEANIDRFVGLLREFQTSTQFIVITHSKRTMTCADTLHGVTMQESGVSKRVSVRFEDVGEDGRIRASALRNDAGNDQPRAQAA